MKHFFPLDGGLSSEKTIFFYESGLAVLKFEVAISLSWKSVLLAK
jgi:hypothetical protein